MPTLQASHALSQAPFDSAILNVSGLRKAWFEGSPARSAKPAPAPTAGSPTLYNSHLGVLRPETPTIDRQRRYDFWFRRP